MRKLLSSPRAWFAVYACWFGVLFILSSQAAVGPDVVRFPHADKVAHAVYFAAGSVALGVGLLLARPRLGGVWVSALVVLAAFAVGCFDEWHQLSTPGRSGGDAGDVAADVFGGVVGVFVALRLFGFASARGASGRVAA